MIIESRSNTFAVSQGKLLQILQVLERVLDVGDLTVIQRQSLELPQPQEDVGPQHSQIAICYGQMGEI